MLITIYKLQIGYGQIYPKTEEMQVSLNNKQLPQNKRAFYQFYIGFNKCEIRLFFIISSA